MNDNDTRLTDQRMTLETAAMHKFNKLFYYSEEYKNQRYGQAFYNHFKLHECSDQTELHKLYKLYELDGRAAKIRVTQLFEFN